MLRKTGPALLLCVVMLLFVWSAVVWLTGGFAYQGSWGRVSSRDPIRPLIAGILGVLGLIRWLGRAWLVANAHRASAALDRFAPVASVVGALALVWVAVKYGTYAATGADAYGYVSQADLWARGHLSVDFTSLAPLPWPDPEWTLSPLGYRPGTEPYRIVPTYSAGLPMLMALVSTAFGPRAMFFVVPVCAGLAVWLTYLLGRQLYDSFVGFVAAGLLAASPVFLYHAMVPLSDVPVTTFWTLALVSANGRRHSFAALSGLATTVAVLTRPNLVPLAVVPAILITGGTVAHGARHLVRRLGLYTICLLPGPVVVAILNTHWYGSPLQSGYGSFDYLYAVDRFWPNVRLYGQWLVETQSLFVAFALLPFVFTRSRHDTGLIRHRYVRAAIVAFTVILLISYLFYLVFKEWPFLRFLLPAFPFMLVLAAGGLASLLRPVLAGANLIVVLVGIALCAWMIQVGAARAIFDLQRFEHRYIRVARDIRAITPDRAVFLSLQHSGSLRYYAQRLTLRYDFMPTQGLNRAVEALHARGMPPYLLLEDWEEPAFVARFRDSRCHGRLSWKPVRQWQEAVRIRLYDLSQPDCAEK
jgi:hypothetical protein